MTLPLRFFVQESMALENINDPVSLLNDITQHDKFLKLENLEVEDVSGFARAIDPKADFIKSPAHTDQLKRVLETAMVGAAAIRREETETRKPQPDRRAWLAYITHRAFNEVAPFVVSPMNGIVNRAIWLWIMGGQPDSLFSHTWYRQTLRFGGTPEVKEKTNVI